MSNTRRSVPRVLVLAAFLLLVAGGSPAAGQIPRGLDTGSASNFRPPSPSSALGKSAATPSSGKAKQQQDIKEAIDTGNTAREKNNYELAVSSYERVTKLDPKDARAHYGLANVYGDLTCFDSAIGEYREALRLKNDFDEARLALGYVFLYKERLDEAEQQFSETLRSKPNDVAANIALAVLSAKRKKYEEATARLKRVIDSQSTTKPDRATAHLVLGDVFREQEKWPDARSNYHEAIKFNPDLAKAYVGLGLTELLPVMSRYGGFPDDALTAEDRENLIRSARQAAVYFRQAIYERNYNHPFGYIFFAISLEWQLSFREAENSLNEYLKKIKGLDDQLSSLAKTRTCDYGFATLYANAYRQLGFLYDLERRFVTDNQKKLDLIDKTIENFKKVTQLKEGEASAFSQLGSLFVLKKQYSEAIESLDKAIFLETDESRKADAYAGRGFAYSRLGRSSEAIEDLNRAIKIRPENSLYYLQLASVYTALGNLDEAIRLKTEAMAREAQPAAFWYYFLATSYYDRARQKGNETDYEKAIELADKAISLNRTSGDVYLLLGNIYRFYKKGIKIDEAIKNYELAVRYNPKNSVVYSNIAMLYFVDKQNDDAAIHYFQEALKLNPDDATTYQMLARAYRHKGDDVEAIKQLLESIKRDANNANAHMELAAIYRDQKRYSEAAEYLTRVIGFAPTDFTARKELAKLSEAQGQNQEAIRAYEEAIKLMKPEDVAWRDLYTCRIERLRTRYAEAISCFQRIKLPAEDQATIIYDVGLTYVAARDKNAAISQYEQLKALKSSLAHDLLRQINDMK